MKNPDFSRVLLGALAVLGLHWALVSRASIGAASPDLPLAFAVYLGLTATKRAPVFFLWGFGLAIDLAGPYPTGLHALAFPALGWMAHRAGQGLEPGSPWVRCSMLWASGLILRALQWGSLSADGILPAPGWTLLFVGLSAVLTTAVGMAAFWCFDGFETAV